MPGINLVLQRCDITCLVIMIAIRGIGWYDTIDSDKAPLRHVQIANQLVPLFKTIFPTVHLRIPSPVLVNAGTCRYTAEVTQRERGSGLTSCAKKTFMHKEGKGINRVNTILHT